MNFAALIKETIAQAQSTTHGDPQEQEQDKLDEELENILNNLPPPYSEKDYWDTRYEREPEEFDWYQPWSKLKPYLSKYIHEGAQVLSIGCGNSPMSAEILKDGAGKVFNVDFSHVVIEQMKTTHENEPNLQWDEAEVTRLPYDDATFDFIFDKGTMDSLISTCPTTKDVHVMVEEISRVLKPGGVFAEISYGTPNTRTPFLKPSNLNWAITETCEVEKITEPGTFHYIYIAKKN